MKKRVGLVIVIMLMCICFAAISTTLIINGNTKVSENTQDFDIYFSKAGLDSEDVYKSVISQDKKTITFKTNNLSKLGDKSVLEYEVTNNSNNYDAEVKVTCLPEDNKYTSLTNVLSTENNIVPARNKANGTLTITLKKMALEEVEETYTCTLEFNAVERTSIGESINKPAEPELTNNLVPVTIKDDGTVKKANTATEWYNYENKVWANAVILKDDYEDLKENGKINGATKEENQVSFDGVDDYINLGLENYDFKDSISMAIKVKFNNTNIGRRQYVFGNWESGGGGIYLSDKGKIGVDLYSITLGSYVNFESKAIMSTNSEYTIVLNYDGSFLKLYINGIFVSQENMTGDVKTSVVNFDIASNPGKNDTHDGNSNITVKKAAIYDRALSEEEITKYYKDDIVINDDTDLLKYVNFEKATTNNETIPEDNIESYFVWIPRFRYKLFNVDNMILDSKVYTNYLDVPSKAKEIEIEFESKYDKVSNGSKNGEWLTHPAFTSFDSNGFWVGKFETGYKGATSKTDAQVNATEPNKIIIKPNVYSWRGINIKNGFEASHNYQRNLDSHMMKNMEWGATAYLSHSKYGINNEVRINNNSDLLTGYSSLKVPTCGLTNTNEICNQYGTNSELNTAYNSSNGYLASTTGNISGVYDMSGGAWEYLAGYIDGNYGDSGFTSDTIQIYNSKYFDVYNSASYLEGFKYRILGDATGELGPFTNLQSKNSSGVTTTRRVNSWYNDDAYFVFSTSPWVARGGAYDYGQEAGQFSFHVLTGTKENKISFRIVLTP